MPKGFGLSNSGSKNKKNKLGKFVSKPPASKEVFVVVNFQKNLETIPTQIKPFYKQVRYFGKFIQNDSILWSNFLGSAGKFFNRDKVEILAEYLTINTKQCNAVVRIYDKNQVKIIPYFSYTYDKSCEKLEKKILEIFGKMPTFDEYFQFNLDKKLARTQQNYKDVEELPPYFILSVNNLESFDVNKIWDDDDDYYAEGITGFDGFNENRLRYSEADAYYIDEELEACKLAEYLTIRTQKNHVVIGILENGTKDVCIEKYEYDDKLKKQHQVLLEKFAKMPEYNEYLNYISELLDQEIKKS